MKRMALLSTMIMALLSAPAEAKKPARLKAGEKVTLAGKFVGHGFPHRLILKPGLKSSETIFVHGLSAEDTLRFDGLRVKIEGEIEDARPQFFIRAKKIERASAADVSLVILKRQP